MLPASSSGAQHASSTTASFARPDLQVARCAQPVWAHRLVPPSVASGSLAEVRPRRQSEGAQLPPHPAALSLGTSTAIGTRDTQSFNFDLFRRVLVRVEFYGPGRAVANVQVLQLIEKRLALNLQRNKAEVADVR
jgi:hypothetical protein